MTSFAAVADTPGLAESSLERVPVTAAGPRAAALLEREGDLAVLGAVLGMPGEATGGWR